MIGKQYLIRSASFLSSWYGLISWDFAHFNRSFGNWNQFVKCTHEIRIRINRMVKVSYLFLVFNEFQMVLSNGIDWNDILKTLNLKHVRFDSVECRKHFKCWIHNSPAIEFTFTLWNKFKFSSIVFGWLYNGLLFPTISFQIISSTFIGNL